MPKFYGIIGYCFTEETSPGVCTEKTFEKKYRCDLLRNSSRHQSAQKLNDDITISNEVSIVANPYAYANYQYMRYVVFKGCKWKITNADASFYPRIILTLGGIYNE